MRSRFVLAAALCGVCFQQAAAADELPSADGGATFGLAAEVDFEHGGDDFATVNFEDGDSQDISTGQGLTLALGAQYKPSEVSPFGVRATVGYKFATTAADNADIGIDRFVFEVLANYRLPMDFWFGVGLTHHTNVEFNGDGFGPDVSFDDATGPTLEFGWKWFALSYTDIDYTDEFGGEWDAGSFGVTVTSAF